MKDRYGETVLQELVYEKVLSEKYTVTDKEVKAKTDELKAQMGENFETALASSGYKSEADLKRALKIGMLQEKAAVADIKVKEADVKKLMKTINHKSKRDIFSWKTKKRPMKLKLNWTKVKTSPNLPKNIQRTQAQLKKAGS